jgi:hypothetical protein
MLPAAQPTCFLIADISGYTGYLADVELDHAQDILADLIGAVVTALRPNFRLAKLEGDAAFTFATAEKIDGSMLLDTIERCYFGFRRRRDVRQAMGPSCSSRHSAVSSKPSGKLISQVNEPATTEPGSPTSSWPSM